MEGCWNPWHGCRKYSEGCANCYVYRRDSSVGRDASQVAKTAVFDKLIKRNRSGEYVIPGGQILYACMTSDFFLEEADPWRGQVWEMFRERQDIQFRIITKRIARFEDCIPPDWGEGYGNVSIGCTVENQRQCDIRLPLYQKAAIRRKFIICEPLLGKIDLSPYLDASIEQVVAGGESGDNARLCDYDWVLELRRQCEQANVNFYFKQTGAVFRKEGRIYHIPRYLQHEQAKKAKIHYQKKDQTE